MLAEGWILAVKTRLHDTDDRLRSGHVLLVTLLGLSLLSLLLLTDSSAKGTRPEPVALKRFAWRPAGPFGGEAHRLAFDPSRPGRYYLGTSDGLVYRSSDGGRSWQRLQPGLKQDRLSIEALIVDRSAPRRLYIGGWNVRRGRGGGVYVSEDQGQSWEALPEMQGHAIRALIQSPSHPQVLLAGATDGVFRSDDGGQHWRRISPPSHAELKNVEALALDPGDPDIIYVGTWHLPWKTRDGGRTWELIGGRHLGMTDDSDIFSILVDRRSSQTVYMGACTGVYRSGDGGLSWRKVRGIPSSSRRTQIVRQHPLDPAILLAGTTQGLWRSTDRGSRWSLVTDRRLVVNDVAIHPLKPNRVLLATDHGVFLSVDGGRRFSPANDGFAHRTVSAIQLDVEDPARIYVGTLSAGVGNGLYVSDDHGFSWQEMGRGLAGVDVFCLSQSRLSPNNMVAGTNRGLYHSTDRGRHWARLPPRWVRTSRGKGGKSRGGVSPSGKVLALTPLKRPGRVLLLTPAGLYRVQLTRSAWQPVFLPQLGERLLTVYASQTRVRTVYLGTSERLMISHDGGQSWDSIPVYGYPVQAVCEAGGLVYVGTSFGLFRLSGVDGHPTWTRCGGGLPQISVSALIVNPEDENEIIVGDRRHGGLYSSQDGGIHWARIDSGFASARISVLAFAQRSGALYVGTVNSSTYVGQRRQAEVLLSSSAGGGKE